MPKRENKYQAGLIRRIEQRFPGCLVLKNDEQYMQGIPDLTILHGRFWGVLEVKRSATEPKQPNQDFYVEYLAGMSFAAFIYPENEEEVLDALQRSLEDGREPRVPESKLVPLGELLGGEVRPARRVIHSGTARRRTPRVRPASHLSRTETAEHA